MIFSALFIPLHPNLLIFINRLTMEDNFIKYSLLEVQTVGPEGNKLIWVFLIVIITGLLVLFIKNKKELLHFSVLKKTLLVKIDKNRLYHPSLILLKIKNRSNKAILVNHPIIRFKKRGKTKAFKIKTVNSSSIYPLYLEANKTHELPVALQAFYDYNSELKKYSSLRIEFTYDNKTLKKTRYLLLIPTLFRKAKS